MTTQPARRGAPSRPAKDLPSIGKLLRTLRGPLTIAVAAGRCGQAPPWWHRRETGDGAATVDDLAVIAKAFGVTISIDASGRVSAE